MDLGLAGATVAVNGGSKGMGRAAAEAIAAEGSRVAVLARGQEALEATAGTLVALGAAEALPIPTDITDREQVESAFARVADRWGELNVLVNAAGPVDVGIGPFDDLDDDEWIATFDIGTLTTWRDCPGSAGSTPTTCMTP